MTDEELKKKCTERAKIFQQAMENCHSSSLIDCIEWFADRIAELEEENKDIQQSCENYYNEMRFYKNKVAELEAQIEKMKCCENCKGTCNSDDVARFCKDNGYKLWGIKEK